MSRIYLDNWLKKTDVDYYTMFIFSWIPFNAWYVDTYYDYEQKIESDRDIISKIKIEENPFRNKIINLIRTNSEEANDFRKNIHNLYRELESNTIPNQEKRVSFSSLRTHDNPKRQEIFDYKRKTYKFEYLINQPRQTKRFRCEIISKSSGRSVSLIELHRCTDEELQQHQEFQTFSEEIQSKIMIGFNEINPNKPSSIMGNKRTGLKIFEEWIFRIMLTPPFA